MAVADDSIEPAPSGKMTCKAAFSLLGGERANRYAPSHIKEIGLDLEVPNSSLIHAARKGETVSYVIDNHDRVYFVRGEIDTESGVQLVVNNTAYDSTETDIAFIPKAVGRIEFKNNEAILVPTKETFPLTVEEVQAINENLLGLARQTDPKHPEQTHLIKCNKLLAAGQKGAWFITNKLFSGMVTQTAVLGVVSPHRFSDKENYDRLANDYVTTASNTIFRSTIGKYMLLNNWRYLPRLGSRSLSGLASVQIQGGITHLIVGEKPNQQGANSSEYRKALVQYNSAWALFALLKSDAVDHAILKRMPALTYNLCLTNPRLALIVNPHTVRYLEDGVFTAAYYGARRAFFNHKGITE